MATTASIARSQADALADGFLDELGSSKDFTDFKPDKSLAALIKLAALIIETSQKNLNSGGHTASGKLSDSIKVRDPAYQKGKITLDIEALFYYQFLNKGVRGTKSGNSADGFAFKYPNPSLKMVEAISDWLAKAHKVTVHLLKKHSISQTEHKNTTLSDIDGAYMIATSIVRKGIKQTSFFDKAIEIAKAYAQDQLGRSLATDIINSLPKNIDDGDSNKK